MLLIEFDGKKLFKAHGISIAPSFLMESPDDECLVSDFDKEHWIVKAQVPVGGRGKAGGIVRAANETEIRTAVQSMLGSQLKGHRVNACLVEKIIGGDEHYLAIVIDADSGGISLMYSPDGGVDIEASAKEESRLFREKISLDRAQFEVALSNLSVWIGTENAGPIVECARKLGDMFFDLGLLVAEINPLFVNSRGEVIAGDAKVVIDLNGLEKTHEIMDVLKHHAAWYPDVWRKIQENFDFIEIDPKGNIGLITTGAGLSMMLLDEIIARGAKPFNFADIRTGQMRGDPARLVTMFNWLKNASDVRVVLVNVFAGITDLEEFAQILVSALGQMTDWDVPVIARLIGNNEQKAYSILSQTTGRIRLEPDLEKAIELAIEFGKED